MPESLSPKEAAALQEVLAPLLERAKQDRELQLLAATILVAAVGLYAAEKGQGGPIQSFGDALWNVWSTVCSVGESGCPPVTPAGRLIGSVLMLVGSPLYDQTKPKIAQLLRTLIGGPLPEGG
jgi:hypothetical protein